MYLQSYFDFFFSIKLVWS